MLPKWFRGKSLLFATWRGNTNRKPLKDNNPCECLPICWVLWRLCCRESKLRSKCWLGNTEQLWLSRYIKPLDNVTSAPPLIMFFYTIVYWRTERTHDTLWLCLDASGESYCLTSIVDLNRFSCLAAWRARFPWFSVTSAGWGRFAPWAYVEWVHFISGDLEGLAHFDGTKI